MDNKIWIPEPPVRAKCIARSGLDMAWRCPNFPTPGTQLCEQHTRSLESRVAALERHFNPVQPPRITADTLASWSSGHTLLADNRSNRGTFSLSFGEIADRINEFFGVK